jgi:hypothetical protein
MHSAIERACRYRDRAEELRTLIEGWSEPFAREALERVAEDFDALADKLDPSRAMVPHRNGNRPMQSPDVRGQS